MSIKSRTIDNLGIEASNQYAKGQQSLDLRLVEESRFLPSKIEGGLAPYIPGEGEESFTIFTIGRASIWAAFTPPPKYDATIYHLYTYTLIPSLGTSEQLQALDDKFETVEKKITREKEREYKKLRALIKHLLSSSRTFELIKSRCNQYQRG
jgi:hypothetical protein